MTERPLVYEQIVECEGCELHAKCKGPVPFSGPTPALIAIVGEAPGRQEDERGEPFIGAAGALLRKHLGQLDFDPAEIFICNTVSCFPNGTPTKVHVDACQANKMAQLELAAPTYVLLLGKVALQAFRPDVEISRARGRVFCPTYPEPPAYMATYHPAAALRNRLYETEMRKDLERFRTAVDGRDFLKWMELPGQNHCWWCSAEAVFFDADAVGSCTDHPTAEAKARKAFLAEQGIKT